MRYINQYTTADYNTKLAEKQLWLENSGILDDNDDENYTIVMTPTNKCIVFTSMGSSTVKYTNVGGNAPVVECSRNGIDWESWDGTAKTVNKNSDADMFLFVRGVNVAGEDGFIRFSQSSTVYTKFELTGDFIKCDGNLSSLIHYDITDTIEGSYALAYVFKDCINLVRTPSLPATTLSEGCYYGLFLGCTRIKKLPKLPATSISAYAYAYMFQSCTSLKSAINLTEATTLGVHCYHAMFYKCSNLTVPPILSCPTLSESCYQSMFNSCSSLTYGPELPATVPQPSCYNNMFAACTSLIMAPKVVMSSTSSSCFSCMFQNCYSLLEGFDMENISYYGWGACQQMYQSCRKLKKHPKFAPSITMSRYAMYYTFADCWELKSLPTYNLCSIQSMSNTCMYAACTRLTDISGLTIDGWCSGGNNSQCLQMFRNCTSLVNADMKFNCSFGGCNTTFYGMFQGCTSLKKLPKLPDTGGYWPQRMFAYIVMDCTSLEEFEYNKEQLPDNTLEGALQNCTSIKRVQAPFTNNITSSTAITNNWLKGASRSALYVKNINATWERTDDTGIPEGWRTIYINLSTNKYYIDQAGTTECDRDGNVI